MDYVKFLDVTHKEADEARKPLESQWLDAWNLFHNQFNYSGKAGWQTKLRWSPFPGTIETAASTLKRALVEARTWYTIDGMSPADKLKAPLIKRMCDLWLEFANFVVLFTDGIKMAGITDFMAFKVSWPEWEEEELAIEPLAPELAGLGILPSGPKLIKRRRSGLRIDLLDSFRVWLDPSGRNRHVIEKSRTDLDELRTMARLNPRAWDIGEISKLEASAESERLKFEENVRQGLASTNEAPWRKPIELMTFWGDVVSDTGTVEKDVTFSVANGVQVGRTRPIPEWHKVLDRRVPNKRGPILWGSLFRIPLAVYGKGFSRDGLDIAKFQTELACGLGDQTLFAGLSSFEVDRDLIDDPEQFKDGVFPGKTFTKVNAEGRDLITPRVLGQVNPQLLAVQSMYDRLYQNTTGVTNYIDPGQTARQAPTLGEYRGRQTQSLGLMDMIARNVEDQLLEPLLETVYWLILQYMDDFGAAPVVEALGDDAIMLASMSDLDRFNILKASVRFQARGMSIVLAKAEELQKVVAFLQVLPPLLSAVPQLALVIQWEALFRKVIEGLVWDPDEILKAPQQIAIEQERMMAQGAMSGTATPQVPPNGQMMQQGGQRAAPRPY